MPPASEKLDAFNLIVVHENGYREHVEFVAPSLAQAVAALEKRNPGCAVETNDAVSED